MTEQYPPPTYQPAPAAVPGTPPSRRVSALWQTVVICFVGLTVSGALVALSLFSRNLFVPLVLAGTIIAVAVGIYAAIQGWKGSQRAAARGAQGRAARHCPRVGRHADGQRGGHRRRDLDRPALLPLAIGPTIAAGRPHRLEA